MKSPRKSAVSSFPPLSAPSESPASWQDVVDLSLLNLWGGLMRDGGIVSTAMEYRSPRSHVSEEQGQGRAFAKVEIHRQAGPILAAWAELEAITPASVYQTLAFLLPWLETLGAARKVEPLFI